MSVWILKSHRFRHAARLAIATCLLTLALPQQGRAQGSGDSRGYLLSTLDAQVLEEQESHRRMTPASVLKLLTAAVALDRLGPDHVIETVVLPLGERVGSELRGDLVVVAAADPSWSEDFQDDPAGGAEPVSVPERLARAIVRTGLERVKGRLVVDTSRFPGRRFPTDRATGDVAYSHGTPPAALAVERAQVKLDIGPGPQVGDAPRLGRRTSEHIEWINRALTASRELAGKGTLDIFPIWGSPSVLIQGEYPISEGRYLIPVASPTPVLDAATAILRALEDQGVVVDGGVAVERRTASGRENVEPLVVVRSPPLVELVEPVLFDSDNWVSEMLLWQIALSEHDVARSRDGARIVEDFVERKLGLPEDEVVIVDGSGLSRQNLVTPRAVVALLRYVWGQPWRDAFVDAMARPGEGTLETWPRLPSLSAKTGTLRYTSGLAGFLSVAGSETPLVFCYLVNDEPARWGSRATIVKAVRSWARSAPAVLSRSAPTAADAQPTPQPREQ